MQTARILNIQLQVNDGGGIHQIIMNHTGEVVVESLGAEPNWKSIRNVCSQIAYNVFSLNQYLLKGKIHKC